MVININSLTVFSHGSYSKYCLPKGIFYDNKIKIIDNKSLKYLPLRITMRLGILKLYNFRFVKASFFRLVTYIFFGKNNSSKQKVLFFEYSRLAKLEGYIEYLRMYRKNFILIYYLSNSRPKEYFIDNKKMLSSFDQIFSFSKEEAIRHGLIYARIPILSDRIISNKKCVNNNYGIYFIGKNKGRLNELNKISDIFKLLNLNFKFIIFDDSNMINKDKYPDLKFISKPLKYEKIINQLNCSDVVLDLYSKKFKDESSYTLRLTEALVLNKKIITNNSNIISERFYDPKKILYFQDHDELKSKITNFLNYEQPKYSKNTFKDFLPDNLIKEINNIN